MKVRKDVALEKIATLACGVSTGLGAVFNAARVEAGASVVVIGCGGVGVSAIVGADLAHAGTIVAVDIADDKLEFARSMGATHTVNAKTSTSASEMLRDPRLTVAASAAPVTVTAPFQRSKYLSAKNAHAPIASQRSSQCARAWRRVRWRRTIPR